MDKDLLPEDPDLIHLSESHPVDGRVIRYHADEFNLNWITALGETLTHSPQFSAAEKYFRRDLLLMYIENALFEQLQPTGEGYIRRAFLKYIGRPSRKPIACPKLLMELVRKHLPDSEIQIIAEKTSVFLRRKMGFGYRRLRDFVERYSVPPSNSDRRYTIAVELFEGSDLTEKCDAFWLAQGDIDPEQVLFILENNNRNLFNAEKEYANIKRMGAGAIALHKSVSADGQIPRWRMPSKPSWLRAYRSSLPGALKPEEHWLTGKLLHLGEQVHYWESLFRHFGIKMYQHFTEGTIDVVIRRIAINRVGGVEMGKMRSFFEDTFHKKFFFQHELAFVLNSKIAQWFNANQSTQAFPIGYTWDYLIESKKKEGGILRSKLLKGKVDKIITLYDQPTHLNGRYPFEQLECFYEQILQLVLESNNIGLIVKSKHPKVLDMMPQMKDKLCDLTKQNRCLIIDQKLCSAIPAALAADLVVTMPAGTVAIEAALAGRCVLMYQAGAPSTHPLDFNKGLIYREIEEFIEAVRKNLLCSKGSSGEKNQLMLSSLDEFRDGKAAERASNIISNYLRTGHLLKNTED